MQQKSFISKSGGNKAMTDDLNWVNRKKTEDPNSKLPFSNCVDRILEFLKSAEKTTSNAIFKMIKFSNMGIHFFLAWKTQNENEINVNG